MSSSYEKPALFDMDADQLKMYLQLLPKLPLVARVALLHMLQMSPPSKYLDLRTEVTVAVVRSFLTPAKPVSISSTQRLLNKDPGIKGRIWVAKYTAPAPPGTSIRDAVVRAIDTLSSDSAITSPSADVQLPDIVPVEAEWHGYREGATPSSRLPPILEVEKYQEMMKEAKSPVTVLYLHGGAYYLMDPASHRPTTKKLAKLTGGRCYSVRYRLAPQNPFPAALMDALQSYLTLLYPPQGAFHQAVRPEDIVFAGDSAGGNLTMALIQLLLEFRRQDIKVTWYGNEVSVPIPAGAAMSSPWMDMTHSSPSCKNNAPFDYLPMLQGLDKVNRPSCDAWPSKPPRKMLYCADNLIAHPLVTLLMAKNWEGCPPVYICTGWELLSDEDKFMASKLHAEKVPVVFEEFEAMPHCFALIFSEMPGSKRCFDSWSGFIKDCVENPTGIEPGFRSIKAKTLKEVDIDPMKLSPYTEMEMLDMIRKKLPATNAPEAAGDTQAKL